MGVKDPNGCKRPAVLFRKVLHKCEKPAILSEKFCMGVKDPRCDPKSVLPKRKHTVKFIT